MSAKAIVTALMLACLPVAAAAEPPPLTPEAVAKSRAEGEQVIAAAGAGRYFEVYLAVNVAVVRHKPSGMTCNFAPDWPGNRIVIRETALPRGEDVICTRPNHAQREITFARRAGTAADADQALILMAVEAGSRYGDLTPYDGQGPAVSEEVVGQVEHPPRVVVGRFTARDESGPLFVRIAVMVVDGWIIGHEVSGPLDQARDANFLGEWSIKEEVWNLPGPNLGE